MVVAKIASDSHRLRFESGHGQYLLSIYLFTVNCNKEKRSNKDKGGHVMAHLIT